MDKPLKIFCDLDGVMSDLESKVGEIIGGGYSQARFEQDRAYQQKMWRSVVQWSEEEGNEFWGNMDMLPNARILWERISEFAEVEILTATGTAIADAGDQKRRWVARMLCPNVKVNLVRTAALKAQYAAPNHILVDDKAKAINPWKAAGGLGVLHRDDDVSRTIERPDRLQSKYP